MAVPANPDETALRIRTELEEWWLDFEMDMQDASVSTHHTWLTEGPSREIYRLVPLLV